MDHIPLLLLHNNTQQKTLIIREQNNDKDSLNLQIIRHVMPVISDS